MADTTSDEIIRRIVAAESRLNLIEARDQAELITESYLKLPQLRGYWPLNTHRASGGANDQSGTGLNLTLNDDVQYAHSDWLTWATFDGAGDYLSRADEAALDILGTETYVAAANRGMTIGGWFYPTVDTAFAGLMGKYVGAVGQRSYLLLINTNTNISFNVSVDGTAISQVVSPNNTLVLNTWWFVVGRFTPSTELKLWMNENTYTNVAAIPASIFNSPTTFMIGAQAANYLTGRAALCFLCAGILSDNVIEDLFERTRWLFGV